MSRDWSDRDRVSGEDKDRMDKSDQHKREEKPREERSARRNVLLQKGLKFTSDEDIVRPRRSA